MENVGIDDIDFICALKIDNEERQNNVDIQKDEVNQANIIQSLGDRQIARYDSGFVPNNDAIGGCLVMSRECFNDIKGFNENFVDWGYEDNEILIRAHKLGKSLDIKSLNDPRAILFHLPHEASVVMNNATETLASNEAEVHKIENFTKEQIEEYIESW